MANEDAGRKRDVTATEDRGRARATGARKPGVIGNMMERCRETVAGICLPRADWKTFAWGLVLLIAIFLIIRNWAPVRLNVFGWYLDAPKAVVLAIFFGLGMVTTWLIEAHHRRARGRAVAGEQAPLEIEDDFDEEDLDFEDEAPGGLRPGPEEFAEAELAGEAPLHEEEEPERSSETGDEVRPAPEEFAAGEVDDAGDDESVSFDEPAPDPDAMRSLDDELDADVELAGDSVVDPSSADDEGESKPFWRL